MELEDNSGGPNPQYSFLFQSGKEETWRAPRCPTEQYLIHIRASDSIPCVAIWAGSTLEAIPGVCASDTSEAGAGITPACWASWASWGCWRSYGHQCVWGWGLKAEGTWKTRPVRSTGLVIHVEYVGHKMKFGFLMNVPLLPANSCAERLEATVVWLHFRSSVSLNCPTQNEPASTKALTTSLAFSNSVSQK